MWLSTEQSTLHLDKQSKCRDSFNIPLTFWIHFQKCSNVVLTPQTYGTVSFGGLWAFLFLLLNWQLDIPEKCIQFLLSSPSTCMEKIIYFFPAKMRMAFPAHHSTVYFQISGNKLEEECSRSSFPPSIQNTNNAGKGELKHAHLPLYWIYEYCCMQTPWSILFLFIMRTNQANFK